MEPEGQLSHRQMLVAVSGVFIGMFVATISGTIVINALPRIIPELGGSQTGYTWVVIANLLMITATTPIWGKLADQFNLKRLVQTALAVYVVGAASGALAQNIPMLIGSRATMGVGIGGLVALSAAVIARIVPPLQRGKFNAYQNVMWAVGNLSGPFVGGIITDSPLGWRGCFFAGIPFAILSFAMMAKTLRVPHHPRPVKVDYVGGTLIVAGVSVLLALLSLGGSHFGWISGTSFLLAGISLAIVSLALFIEAKVAEEPVIRLGLFANRTIALATVTSALIGIAILGATVYLTQYYQYSRGLNPTQSGLLTCPMVGALAIAGVINGRINASSGQWKPMSVLGGTVMAAGLFLIGLWDHSTPIFLTALASAVLGVGLGCTTSNLLLAVQTVAKEDEVGSASALFQFAQSLGGTTAIAVLGTLLSSKVQDTLPQLGGSLPKPSQLPEGIREAYKTVVGDSIGDLFLYIVPLAVLGLILTLLIPATRLATPDADEAHQAADNQTPDNQAPDKKQGASA